MQNKKKPIVIENSSAYQLVEVVKDLSFNIAKFDPYKASTDRNNVNNTITVNVPVNATVNSDTDINTLADKVTDRIKTPLINALAGDENGY